jgi:hypothetical protein
VAGDPGATGPHYRVDPRAAPSARTEVWLDVRIRPSGDARSYATVPFAVPAGRGRSIVIHAEPTRPDGQAGARLACIPIGI